MNQLSKPKEFFVSGAAYVMDSTYGLLQITINGISDTVDPDLKPTLHEMGITVFDDNFKPLLPVIHLPDNEELGMGEIFLFSATSDPFIHFLVQKYYKDMEDDTWKPRKLDIEALRKEFEAQRMKVSPPKPTLTHEMGDSDNH